MAWKEHATELTNAQALAMSLGLHLRNEIEGLHNQIPDTLMAELNVAIRYGLHDFFARVVHNGDALNFLERSIPPYWEVPGINPRPTFTGEPLWQGKPIRKPDPNGMGNPEDL